MLVIWPYAVIKLDFWQRSGQGQFKKGQIFKSIYLHKKLYSKFTQDFIYQTWVWLRVDSESNASRLSHEWNWIEKWDHFESWVNLNQCLGNTLSWWGMPWEIHLSHELNLSQFLESGLNHELNRCKSSRCCLSHELIRIKALDECPKRDNEI